MATIPKSREQVFKPSTTHTEADVRLKQGRKKTSEETSIEADNYLIKKKKGLTYGR